MFSPEKSRSEAEGREEEFCLWEEPLTEQEIKDNFWFIKRFRASNDPHWIEEMLPNLLGQRLKKELKKRGKELAGAGGGSEDEDKKMRGILKAKNYRWRTERNESGREERELEILQHIATHGGEKWEPLRFNLKGEELERVIDEFLKQIMEIKQEKLEQVRREKDEIDAGNNCG